MAESAADSPTKDDDSSNTSTTNNPDEHQPYSSGSGQIKEEDYTNPSPPPSSNEFEQRESNYSALSSPMPPHSEQDLSLNCAPSTVSSRSSPAHSVSSQGGGGGSGTGLVTSSAQQTGEIDAYAGGENHSGRFITSSPGASNACSNGSGSSGIVGSMFSLGPHHDQLLDKHDFNGQGGSNIVSRTALKYFK